MGECLAHLRDDGSVVEVSRGSHDHGLRSITGPVKAVDRRARNGFDGLDRSEDRPAERGIAEERRCEFVVNDVAGIIVMHGDLFENDTAFRLDIGSEDQRIGHDIAHDRDC